MGCFFSLFCRKADDQECEDQDCDRANSIEKLQKESPSALFSDYVNCSDSAISDYGFTVCSSTDVSLYVYTG